MEDTEKTEAETEDDTATEEQPEPEAKAETLPAPDPSNPVTVIAELVGWHATMVGGQVSRSETLSPSDKVAALRIAAFVTQQMYAMALTRIGGTEAAKPVPYLPLDVNSCMRTAELLSKTLLGEAQEEKKVEEPEPEPLIVVPGRENNRHKRRKDAAKGGK